VGTPFTRRYSKLLRVPLYSTPDLLRHIGREARAVTYRCAPEETPRLRADLVRALDGKACVTASHAVLVDVNPRGADKGRALRTVQRVRGITPAETLSIGDSPNDLSLLLKARLRACVANACPELRAAATYVAGEPRGRGVLECLQRFGVYPGAPGC
jgi:hydroxymethylpyrimidine pyrophosphatase-like HAD family hydrolase